MIGEFKMEYRQPFYYLFKRSKFLWFEYWEMVDFSHDLEMLEEIVKQDEEKK